MRIYKERDPHHIVSYDPTFQAPNMVRPGSLLRFAAGEHLEAWLAMVLTNWMGDDAFLWKSRSEIRKFCMLGDTCFCKGKVIKKYCDNGKIVLISIAGVKTSEVRSLYRVRRPSFSLMELSCGLPAAVRSCCSAVRPRLTSIHHCNML